MRRRWWKAYFFVALVFTVAGLALPFFIEESTEMAWWEWIYIPLYTVQIVGLFGFAYWRRVGIPPFWQLVFLASVAYEIWNFFSMGTDPELSAASNVGFLLTIEAATLALQLPMLVALFLYGFRSRELWHGAT